MVYDGMRCVNVSSRSELALNLLGLPVTHQIIHS